MKYLDSIPIGASPGMVGSSFKTWLVRVFTLITMLCFNATLFAQVGPPNSGTATAGTTAYTFASSSGTYTAITGGTQWQSGTTLNTDAVSAAVNIGFDFRYNNRTYSSVRISNNGFITFGPIAPTTTNYGIISVTSGIDGAIAGFGANLRASAVAGATPEIRYETTGSSPNRTFVVQYQDMAILATGTAQRLSFQIRLSETSNNVSIVYGTCAPGASASTGQVGLRGASQQDGNNRAVTAAWTASTTGTANNSTCSLNTTVANVPASGLTYTWTPGATWPAASYATLPYSNNFGTWSNVLNTADSPGSNVRTWPSRGDNSWRAENAVVSTGFTSIANWTGITQGTPATTVGAPASSPVARFHSYDARSGQYGFMDFYLDMSSSPIGLYNVSFNYNNADGTDALQVFYSGDGGSTFTQLGANISSSGNAWLSAARQTTGTATSVIRIQATSDWGQSDIFVDNLSVTALTCAPPTALAFVPSSATGGTLSWTNPTSGTPTNYEYEVRTSGAAGSGATGLVTSGTVANPSNSAVLAAGTLAANTSYSLYVRTDCGGGDLSGWTSAFAFTTPCTPSTAPYSQTFATAYSLAPTGNPSCWREATGATNLSGNSTVTTGTNSWGSSNFANVAGNTGFKINLYESTATAIDAWVVTEPITLGAGSWALAYDMAVTSWNGTNAISDIGPNAVRVIVSTDFGATWSSANIIKTYTGAAAYSTTGAKEYVSLDTYAGQTIQIAFVAAPSGTANDCDFHLDNIAVITPCSGTPVIGASAAATPSLLGCNGSVVNLTMDAGAQVGQGVTYQWQSSSDGITFANIAGATGSTYATPAAVINTTYYRGTATCVFSTLTNTTSNFVVTAGFPTPVVSSNVPNFCGTGGSANLTATITGANPYDTFVWGSPETGVLSNETNTTATFTVTNSAAYTYTVTDTETGCSRSVAQSLNVLATIAPELTATPQVVCEGGTSVINSGLSAGNFSSGSISHSPATLGAGATTLVNAGTVAVAQTSGTLDDGGWSNVPIGFTFNFFGTPYTTCNVSTNGTVTFGTYVSAAMSDFTFTTLPSATEPNPMIAILAMDNNLAGATGGAIKYQTLGYPGNRTFIVSYEAVQEFGDTKFSTAQMKIFEATGIIEVHVTSSTNVDRVKLIGVNGPGGAIGALAYNSGTTASAINPISSPIAYRFIPPTNYTCQWKAWEGTDTNPSTGTEITSSVFTAPNAGNNIFSKTTNALNATGTKTIVLNTINQVNFCPATSSIALSVVSAPAAITSAGVTAYGANLGSSSAAVSPLTICGAQTVTLNYIATLGPNEVVSWFDVAAGGTALATGLTYTTAELSANKSIWIEISNGACPPTARYEYVITYNAPPTVTVSLGAGEQSTYCGLGSYTNNYTATSTASYSYTWTNDGQASSFSTSGAGAVVTSSVPTVSTVTAYDGTTGCGLITNVVMGIYDFPVITPTSLNDSLCVNGTMTVSSGVAPGNFSVECIGHNWRTAPAGAFYLANNGVKTAPPGGQADLSLDDGKWGGIPIGFTFDYFGTDYTVLNAGTNGVANFGDYNTFNGSQYSFPNGFPSTSSPVNTIGVLATDFYMNTTGTLRYWTEGVSPNQVFVLEYLNGPGWTADGVHSAQLHLFETTGKVEIHVKEATGTGTFAGPKTIGLQNGDGTVGALAPFDCALPQGPTNTWSARNATITAAASKAWRFNPPVDYTFAWTSPTSSATSGATNESNVVAAPTVAGTATYQVVVTDNVTGCVGNPVSLSLTVVDLPLAPVVTGQGVASGSSPSNSNNNIYVCGDQNVTLSANNGSGNWKARYYDVATGGTAVYNVAHGATVTHAVAGANDTLWVEFYNYLCTSASRTQVVIHMQSPDAITIANSNPVNCGVGTFTSTLVASSSNGTYTYSWAADPALSVTNGATTVATITESSAFTVTATDGFCSISGTVSVSRYDFPVVNLDAASDSVCIGGNTVITSGVTPGNFSVECIGHNWRTAPAEAFYLANNGVKNTPPGGQANASLDDGKWGGVPIGFTFDYFGTDYTVLNVGTNGVANFGDYAAFNGNQYSFPSGFPSTSSPVNTIGVLATDFYMNTSGTVRYWNEGSAPNRVFVLEYLNGPGWTADGVHSAQLHLFETTGKVEIHVKEATGTGTFAGPKTIGLQNGDGTVGALAPFDCTLPQGSSNTWSARNATITAAASKGWRFNPPVDYTFAWTPINELAAGTLSDQANATVAPTSTTPGFETTYTLNIVDNVSGCTGSFSIPVKIVESAPTADFIAAPTNGTSGGAVTQHNMVPSYPDLAGVTYNWSFSPNTVSFVNGTSAQSRIAQVEFLNAGVYSATLAITNCIGTTTLTKTNYITIVPDYCTNLYTTGTQFGDLISNVSITGTNFNNPQSFAAGAPAYEYFAPSANTTATLNAGGTYTVEVSTGEYGDQGFAAWIDYNDDGIFTNSNDPALNERIGFSTGLVGAGYTPGIVNGSASFTINLGCNPPVGTHRMRVRCAYFEDGATIDPCQVYTYGQTEDYLVTIGGLIPFAPTFTTSSATACTEAVNAVTYTTQANQTSYTWTYLDNANNALVSGTDYSVTYPTQNSATVTWLTAGAKKVQVNYNNPAGCLSTGPATVNTTVTLQTVPGTLVFTPNATNTGGTIVYNSAGAIGSIAGGWRKSVDGGVTWTAISPNGPNSYTFSNLTVETQFRVLVTNGNCSTLPTNVITGVVPGAGAANAVAVNNIGQFGSGVQATYTVNLANIVNNEVWYSFTASANAARISVVGATGVADDNEITLYDGPATTPMIPLLVENSVNSATPVTEQGSEILLTDQLVPNQPYLIKVKNLAAPGQVSITISYLRGSDADIMPYTNYTGIYNNTCQNFKARFRANSKGYTVNRWASLAAANDGAAGVGSPEFVYAIPPGSSTVATTVCQLGRILPAYIAPTGSAPLSYYVTVDAAYSLPNAAGTLVQINAKGNVVSTVGLNAEADLNVRVSDRCPVSKIVASGTIATNRSVCGVRNYEYSFAMVLPSPSVEPATVNGPVGGSRILAISTVPGIGNGHTYDVSIRAKHLDNLSSTNYGTAACVKTTGVAGMPTIEDEGVIAERSFNGVTTSIYPNPNNGSSVNLNVDGMDGELQVRITDATGRMVYSNRYIVEGAMNTTMDFGQTLAGGVYMVEMTQNGQLNTMRMVVNR